MPVSTFLFKYKMGCCCSDDEYTPIPNYKQLTLYECEIILRDRFIHCIVCKNLITTTREIITGCSKTCKNFSRNGLWKSNWLSH